MRVFASLPEGAARVVCLALATAASPLDASTINASFVTFAFTSLDNGNSDTQFNLNQLSAASSQTLSPSFPVTGELNEVAVASGSLNGGILRSKSAGSLPVLFTFGGASSQVFWAIR